MPPVVYFLTDGRRRSYRGFSTNWRRRLRQHRGELAGGARATRGWGGHYVSALITGFPSQRQALSYEWYTKRNRVRWHRAPPGRVPRKLARFCAALCVPDAIRSSRASRPKFAAWREACQVVLFDRFWTAEHRKDLQRWLQGPVVRLTFLDFARPRLEPN